MRRESRTAKSVINILSMVLSKFVGQFLGFITRTVFLYTISMEYLGVGSLFSNVLGLLSLAELGIGGAMIYLLYKPMAEHDEETAAALVQLYKKLYRIIGSFVLVVGLALTPFLDFFIAEKPDIPDLYLIYILYVCNTAITYFLGAYKQAVFQADQKLYIINKISMMMSVVFTGVTVVLLLAFKNYLLSVVITLIQNAATNLTMVHVTHKHYPFVKQKAKKKLPADMKEHLIKTVKGMFLYKMAASILTGTDNLLISKYVSVVAVAKYTNYLTITTIVRTFLYMVFDGILPSLGNLCSGKDVIRIRSVFSEMSYVNYWLSGAAAVALAVLLEPFIAIWAGSHYVMGKTTAIIIGIKFYIQTGMRSTGVIRDAAGLYYESRWLNISQCIVNIIASIALVQNMGVDGVLVGTIVALMTTMFWIQPYLVFKYILEYGRKELLYYYLRQFGMMFFWCAVYLIVRGIISALNINNIILLFLITGIVPTLLFMLVTVKTKAFQCVKRRVKNLIGGR